MHDWAWDMAAQDTLRNMLRLSGADSIPPAPYTEGEESGTTAFQELEARVSLHAKGLSKIIKQLDQLKQDTQNMTDMRDDVMIGQASLGALTEKTALAVKGMKEELNQLSSMFSKMKEEIVRTAKKEIDDYVAQVTQGETRVKKERSVRETMPGKPSNMPHLEGANHADTVSPVRMDPDVGLALLLGIDEITTGQEENYSEPPPDPKGIKGSYRDTDAYEEYRIDYDEN